MNPPLAASSQAPMHGDWVRPSGVPGLAQDEVQIWQIDLADADPDEAAYLSVLTPDETERSAKLRAGQVRMQFLAGRSGLRTLLGAQLGVAPREVPITATEFGKPELASPSAGQIHFNVAHSRSAILIAIHRSGPVGIDIEYLDRKTDVEEVARHSLAEREIAQLMAIGDITARSKFFFECWTRKEAVVKADGRGLSLPLTSFEVPVESSSRPSSVEIMDVDQLASRTYFVSDIAVKDSTACALATADQPCRTRLLRFPPASLLG